MNKKNRFIKILQFQKFDFVMNFIQNLLNGTIATK